MRAGIARLQMLGGQGCVVVGDPGYYERFGFRRDPALAPQSIPAEYFRVLQLAPERPKGVVRFHPGFDARDD